MRLAIMLPLASSRLRTSLFVSCIVIMTSCGSDSSDSTDAARTETTTTQVEADTALAEVQETSTTETSATEAPTTSTTTTSTSPAAIAVEPISDPHTLDDPYVSTYGNRGYDVAHYDLQLDWEPATSILEGVTTISAVATSDLATFNLDLYALEVDAVTIDGATAEYSQDGSEIEIVLEPPLLQDQTFTAVIDYSGTPQEAPGALTSSEPQGWRTRDGYVYVMGEPVAAATYYPSNDHPSDKATYSYDITVPSTETVIVNGTLTTTTEADGRTTWSFEHPYQQAPYLTAIAIGDFEIRQADPSKSGVPIRNAFARFLADETEPIFSEQDEMIDAFEPLFGPYPFDVYGSLVVPEGFGGALETQTLSIYGEDVRRYGGFAELVVAHELAHQWFGNSVTLGSWEDLWLNEGFASYGEALWFEQSDPTFSYERWITEVWVPGPHLETPVHRPHIDNLFSPAVYHRGAMTLHALRVEVGDDTFFTILRTWVERFGGSNASTADFEALAEELSGQDLDALFEAWLRTDKLPSELDGIPIG